MIIRRPLGILCGLFIIILYVLTEVQGGPDERAFFSDGEIICIDGKIEDIIYKNYQYSIWVKDVEIQNDEDKSIQKAIVYLNEDATDFRIGQSVRICGKCRNFSVPENEGQFNLRKYYRIRGYGISVTDAKIIAASQDCSIVRDFLYRRKEQVKKLYFTHMSEQDAGTLTAMVLGDKTGLDKDIKELYQNAGISHVLSLSGLHIATMGLLFLSLLIKCGMSIRLSSVISSAVMVLYAVMTGMSTSTLRALIMFLLGVIAKNIGRTYDLLSAAYFSAILILFDNPYYIYDSGFLLSFSAVLGIGVIYPELETLYSFRKEVPKRIDKVRQSIILGISVSLSTLPVVMNSFYKIAVFSVLINLVIVPLMSVTLMLGIIAGICMKVSLISDVFLKMASVILDLYSKISSFASSGGRGTIVTGKGSILQIAVYIILICAMPVILKKAVCDKRKARLGVILYLFVSLVIISVRILPEYTINVLSVGQGACNIIYGKNIPVIVVDAGSSDIKEVYKYRIEPFLLSKGIRTIDYLFVSHPDKDHTSAITEMIEDDSPDITVNRLVLSLADEELCKLKTKKGKIIMNRGDKITDRGVSIECISPENPLDVSWEEIDSNEASLVLKITYMKKGYTALFTGDISSETEEKIINYQNRKGQVNFMTVPHHGSRFSSSEAFIKYASPEICTISSGEGNSYGHPHEETLDRLRTYAPDSMVLRTDQCGQISIYIKNEEVSVRKFKNNSN